MKIYLACPYSHPDSSVRESRVLAADRMAGRLMVGGDIVFSPLSHSHPISKHCEVDPCDHDFWLRQDLEWLRHCDVVMVLMLTGWSDSRGVATEIAEANRIGIDVVYMDGGWHDDLYLWGMADAEKPHTEIIEDSPSVSHIATGVTYRYRDVEKRREYMRLKMREYRSRLGRQR